MKSSKKNGHLLGLLRNRYAVRTSEAPMPRVAIIQRSIIYPSYGTVALWVGPLECEGRITRYDATADSDADNLPKQESPFLY